MKTLRIALDIGHVRNAGARGNGIEEHARCEVLAALLAPMLEAQGHTVRVFDFPEMKNDPEINKTVLEVNKWGADVGISLHCDSSENAGAHGAHVMYCSDFGKQLASPIAYQLTLLLPGRADRLVKNTRLAMLRATRPAWAYCECGFVSNAADAEVLRDHLDEVAAAISRGVKQYAAKL